jgi:ribonuclease HI
MDTVVLFTDGSCSAKDRVGEYDTTISRMELLAAIGALAEVGCKLGPSVVKVFSDSEYVVKGITDRTRARKINNDLWDALDEVTDLHESVTYQHVKGHAGHEHNEKVDQMARGARNYAKMIEDESA